MLATRGEACLNTFLKHGVLLMLFYVLELLSLGIRLEPEPARRASVDYTEMTRLAGLQLSFDVLVILSVAVGGMCERLRRPQMNFIVFYFVLFVLNGLQSVRIGNPTQLLVDGFGYIALYAAWVANESETTRFIAGFLHLCVLGILIPHSVVVEESQHDVETFLKFLDEEVLLVQFLHLIIHSTTSDPRAVPHEIGPVVDTPNLTYQAADRADQEVPKDVPQDRAHRDEQHDDRALFDRLLIELESGFRDGSWQGVVAAFALVTVCVAEIMFLMEDPALDSWIEICFAVSSAVTLIFTCATNVEPDATTVVAFLVVPFLIATDVVGALLGVAYASDMLKNDLVFFGNTYVLVVVLRRHATQALKYKLVLVFGLVVILSIAKAAITIPSRVSDSPWVFVRATFNKLALCEFLSAIGL